MFELKCWQFILFGAVLELLYQNIIVLIDLLHDFAHQWLNGFDVGIELEFNQSIHTFLALI